MKKANNVQKFEMMGPIPDFKGYTFEELKYQRAILELRKENCKAKLMESFNGLRPNHRSRSSRKSSSKFAFAAKIASKLLSNLNTLDYIMIGVSLFSTLRSLTKGRKR